MQDYPGYRRHLAVKRLLTRALRAGLELRGRLWRARPPAGITGSVVLLDRCLGLGDALMISPALRLLESLGPVTVVTALPPLLDWEGEWLRCPDWAAMTAAVTRLSAGGRLLLVPKLGAGGLLTLLCWRGRLPAGVIRLGPERAVDTVSGRPGAIAGRHYTEGAVAVARALLWLAGGDASQPEPERLPPRLPAAGGAVPALPEGPLVALAPWATSRIRRWPLAHWSALITRLAAARPELGFVLLGSAEERPFGTVIETGAPGARVINLMGTLSLAETTAAIARSAVLVACDNGLMHLGLGVGTPLVAIFGSTDPAARLSGTRWRLAADPGLCPHACAPCYPDLHRDPACPTEAECLSGLTPDRVAALVLELALEQKL
ncbi:MAG: glycosyltransferase family 9 protein [Rhodospirillaceae bacterium]